MENEHKNIQIYDLKGPTLTLHVISLNFISGEEPKERTPPSKPPESEASSPGLRGDISPLTPERNTPKPKGDVSPLTPPPPGSPHTPPLPPKEEVMSPVSDAELLNISPPNHSPETPKESELPSPPPMPPPLPSYMPAPPPPPAQSSTPPPLPPMPPPPAAVAQPPSPITSPIGSSSDDMEVSKPKAIMQAERMSASDISDTELAVQSSESDLEALEAERAKLRAQLEKAKISDEAQSFSEGEVHSSDSDKKTKLDMSPISSESQDDHEEEKAKTRKPPDDDSSGSGGGGSGGDDKKELSPTSTQPAAQEPSKTETGKDQPSSSSSKEKSKSRHHSHHHKERRHSSSKSKHRDRDRERERDRERKHHDDRKKESKKEKKDDKKDKKEKEKRMIKIEEKVNEAFTLKSDKFKSFDMFAPKPKPKPHVSLPRSSASSSSSMTSPSPSFGAVTPPTFGTKTPPSFGSKTPASGKTRSPSKHNVSKEVKKQLMREKAARLELLEPQRKVFPELPVSRCDGDKLKQHEDDFLQAKRKLERKRQELLEQKELAKLRKKIQPLHDDARRKSEEKRPRHRRTPSSSDEETPKHAEKERPHRAKRVVKKFDEDSDDDQIDEIEKKMAEIMGEADDPPPPKTREEIEAAKLLKTDKETKQLVGFDQSDLQSSTLLAEFLDRTDVEDVRVSESEMEEIADRIGFVGSDDFLFLDECDAFKGGAQKLASLLKKLHGGNPKVVHPLPTWLENKLKRWQLKRHQIELVFDVAKVRKRKCIVTEAEYDAKYPRLESETENLTEPANVEAVKEDIKDEEKEESETKSIGTDERFHGFMTQDITAIKQSLFKDDDLDSNGNTFGMVPASPSELKEELSNTQHFLSVGMSHSMISYLKSVLDEPLDYLIDDQTLMYQQPDYDLPPSPISNDSEQGRVGSSHNEP